MSCPLFETNQRLCVSRCATCGTLCEPLPITDLASLSLYRSKGCTLISGDVYITDLDSTVNEDRLFDNLQMVKFLRGGLVIKDNPYLTSLSFLQNIVSVENVTLFNNPSLVDARLPSATHIKSFSVQGSNQLCAARYAILQNPQLSQSDCASLQRFAYVAIYTPVTPRTLDLLGAIVDNALLLLSNNTVSDE